MTRAPACHFCGSLDVVPGRSVHSPLCAEHLVIADHLVSNQRGRWPQSGLPMAACPCGWTETFLYFDQREEGVRAHWQAVVLRQAQDERKKVQAAAQAVQS